VWERATHGPALSAAEGSPCASSVDASHYLCLSDFLEELSLEEFSLEEVSFEELSFAELSLAVPSDLALSSFLESLAPLSDDAGAWDFLA